MKRGTTLFRSTRTPHNKLSSRIRSLCKKLGRRAGCVVAAARQSIEPISTAPAPGRASRIDARGPGDEWIGPLEQSNKIFDLFHAQGGGGGAATAMDVERRVDKQLAPEALRARRASDQSCEL